MRAIEETITADDGAAIRAMRWEPSDGTPPRAVIQFVHGFGEHIAMYEPLAKVLTGHGYAFVIHDQRGHGEMPERTPAARAKALGVIDSYAWFLKDITTVRDRIDDWYPGLPVVLWGLSMGGGIAAIYAERIRPLRFATVVLESPWLRLAKPMPGAVTALARVVGRLAPSLAINAGLDLDAVSRDPEQTAILKADPFYHGRISFRLYTQVLDEGEYAIAHAADLVAPTLLLTGTGDRIVSVAAIRELAANAGPTLILREFDGAFHCLHYDANRNEVLGVVLAFLGRPTVPDA